MENYEKKYKEIVGKIRKAYLYAQTDSTKAVLEDIIPELAESEDEKVRKELTKHLKELSDWKEDEVIPVKNPSYYRQWASWLEKQGVHKPDYCHHEVDLSNCSEEYRKAYYDGWNNCNMQYSQCKSESNDVVKCLINGMKFYYEDNEEATWGTEKFSMKVKDILTWLERQGEHANFLSKIQVGDKVTRNEDGVLVNLSQLERVAKPRGKQGEKKFVIEMKSAEESLGVNSDTYNKIVDECIFGEQKPEENKGNIGGISANWSVEDMSKVQRICKYLNEAKKYYADITEVRECIDWLHSLQDRLQPKQEWSEEDEELVKWSIHNLTELKDRYGEEYGKVGKCIDWLKSIKDRVQQQPKQEWSEEDEEALEMAIIALEDMYDDDAPNTTYGGHYMPFDKAANQLKSLKGRVQPKPMCKFGDTELTNEELCEGLIRGMVDEHNRVTKEVLRTEYEKGRDDVLAKIDAIDVDEMVCESGATSRVTQYWYAHGVNDVIKKLKEEEI